MTNKLVFTGGHHTSALVVAKALKERGWEIIWFGHRHSMWGDKSDSGEYQEVTNAGIKFYYLKAGKFHRTFHPLKLIRIPWGFIQATYWLIKERPQGIVSFGGYLAVPTVIMGWFLGIKSVTHEQTVVTGWGNKLLGYFVQKIAVTWPSSLQFYAKDKAVLVGLPIEENLKNIKAKKPTLFIVGGKQGSHVLNNVIFASLANLDHYEIYHQTGTSTVYNDLAKAEKLNLVNYHPFGYSKDLYLLGMQTADVIISRAGAHSIYDLAVLGKRCVLVPIPWVSHHEQDINAQMLADAGLAIVLPESKLTAVNLLQAITDAKKLEPKPMNLPLDATGKMVDLVESTLG